MMIMMGFGILLSFLSYLGVAGVRQLAEHHRILDIPNERSSHSRPTPRGGGIAIVMISVIGVAVASLFNLIPSDLTVIIYLGGVLFIGGVSYWDDLHSLPHTLRLGAHGVAALFSIWGIGSWKSFDLPFLGVLDLGWLGPPMTFLWIVGLTNAYNFMDGIDGIAGGQGVVAGAGWAVLGWLGDQPTISLLGLLLASSSLGFLIHNWPPARIFMGDVGSAFLGYTFGVLPIMAAQQDPQMGLPGVLLVWPFIFDTTFTFFRRMKNKENLFAAHRSHLYQRLVIAGCSHRFVSVLYIGLSSAGMILSLFWVHDIKGSALFILIGGSLPPMLWLWVRYQERQKGGVGR
jgi:UDP-N-acetylmuramyl pentapeptide phosphotransferase/UDP-N-acetylglucosamine-1-phosphate transferase